MVNLKELRKEIEFIGQNPSIGAMLGGLEKLACAIESLHPQKETKTEVDKEEKKSKKGKK